MSEVTKAWKKWSTGQKAIAIISILIFGVSITVVLREAGFFGIGGAPSDPGYDPADWVDDPQIPIGKLISPADGQTVPNSFSVQVTFTDPNSDMIWSKVSYKTGDGTYRTFMDKKTYAGVKTDTRTKTLSFWPSRESYKLTFKMEGGDSRGMDSIIEKSVTIYFSSQKAPTPTPTPGDPSPGLASAIPSFTLVFALTSMVMVIIIRKRDNIK